MTEAEYEKFNSDNKELLDNQVTPLQTKPYPITPHQAYQVCRNLAGLPNQDDLDLARMDGESLNGGECESYGPFNLKSDNQNIVDIWY